MTFELLFFCLTLLFFLYYVGFVLSAREGLLKLKPGPSSSRNPFVSVVIAARNEQATINECLQSVLKQDYPENRMEIILVNDRSTDNSASIAEDIAARDPRLTVMNVTDGEVNGQSRKPVALAKGIHIAKGEIILTTDGDCTVTSNWIHSMVSSFGEKTVFVAGPVQEVASARLISKLSQLEFLGLVGISAGLIANGNPIICNGANIAFRRKSFEDVGGFGDSGFCDDDVLMQRMKSRRIGEIRYSVEKGSVVSTQAPDSFSTFWKQRIRWASKRGHYEDRRILLKLVGLYCAFVLLFILGIVSFFSPGLFIPFLVLLGIKLFVDFSALRASGNMFGVQVHPLYFGIAQILHVPYIVAAAFAGQFSSLEWKGQQIRG
jgi:cellulose synthase/poly-beta-1,6-N-acetylglucosamine synthase-like glycosyltransferase